MNLNNQKTYVIKVTLQTTTEIVYELKTANLGLAKAKAHTKAIDEFNRLVNCSNFNVVEFDNVKAEK